MAFEDLSTEELEEYVKQTEMILEMAGRDIADPVMKKRIPQEIMNDYHRLKSVYTEALCEIFERNHEGDPSLILDDNMGDL